MNESNENENQDQTQQTDAPEKASTEEKDTNSTETQEETTAPEKEKIGFIKMSMKTWYFITHAWRVITSIVIFVAISWLLMKYFTIKPSCITAGIIAAIHYFVSFATRSKKGYEYFVSHPSGIYMIYSAIAGIWFYYIHDNANQEILFWLASTIFVFSLNTTLTDISGKKLVKILVTLAVLSGLGYFLQDINWTIVGWIYGKINGLDIKYDGNIANIGLLVGIISWISVICSYIIARMYGVHRVHNKTIERYHFPKGWTTPVDDTRNIEADNRDYAEMGHLCCDIKVESKGSKEELYRAKNVIGGWFQLPRIKKCLKIELVRTTNKDKD